ncbi:MAG: protein-export chaperone SecB [Pseudomonadota bacterium]
MSDKLDTEQNAQNNQKLANSPVVIRAQYTKDLSFENPHAPKTFRGQDSNPEMDINIEIDVQKLEDDSKSDLYEVTLKIAASAKQVDLTMFMVELSYAALVSLNIEEKHHHALLFVEVPHTIFPYARQIIADSTQSGGYIPLLLNPVDFKSMYLQRFAKKEDQNEESKGDDKAA